jgi:hypothetical protein
MERRDCFDSTHKTKAPARLKNFILIRPGERWDNRRLASEPQAGRLSPAPPPRSVAQSALRSIGPASRHNVLGSPNEM